MPIPGSYAAPIPAAFETRQSKPYWLRIMGDACVTSLMDAVHGRRERQRRGRGHIIRHRW